MATGLNDKMSKNQTSSTAIEARFAGIFQGEAETGGAVPVPLIAGDLTMESGVDPGTPSKRSTSALGNYEAHSSDGRQMKLDPSNSANGDERARGFVGRDSGRGSKGGNRLTNASRMNHNDRGRGGGGRGRGRGSKGGNFATILL
ncbi:hypothetical protein BT96DRAFT_536718 [Gymnopus androsaceus JB14]|uniref:Uncharacterized protein n=1 Tax=Gymnopus androsaceus JB14 TaxID=1447944 RepID=A0A6A4I0D8_9AGAR|nr:hypothetical protein BT96DRAFT_536718 [Gymnopus androsaceus JB14]